MEISNNFFISRRTAFPGCLYPTVLQKEKAVSDNLPGCVFIRQARMPVLRKGKGCQTTAFSFTEPQELPISLIPSYGSYG
ncbi:MAG TPA: hypothetical protein PKL72_01460, partial [Candidatus Marinimicrobia bacterium]|nr:hypothetical protein [Candidatus Neomarinimicrobiota bacterium]